MITVGDQIVDLQKYLESVTNETNATASKYSGNFNPGTPMRAAPFFGHADVASYATVGLNPSPAEFQQGRWPTTPLTTIAHLNRLSDYFVNPKVPYYESLGSACGSARLSTSADRIFAIPCIWTFLPGLLYLWGAARIDHCLSKWFLAGMTEIRGLLVAGSS
jgi:hypothetical protein